MSLRRWIARVPRVLKPNHPIIPRYQDIARLSTPDQWLILLGAIGLLGVQFLFQVKSVELLNTVVGQLQVQHVVGWRPIVLYLLAQFCIVPGAQQMSDVMLTNITSDMWGVLTLRVYWRIRNGKELGNPQKGGDETLVTSQPDNFQEGLGGQKSLLLNGSSILAASFNVEVLLGWRVALLMAALLVIYWFVVDNTLGKRHAQALGRAKTAKSYFQRLIRHYVRPNGRLYHRLSSDINAQSFLKDKLLASVTLTKDEALKANAFTFVLKVGIAVILFAVFLVTADVIKVTAFVTFLLQSKDLIGSFGSFVEAVTTSQSIEYALGRLDKVTKKNPQFAGLDLPEHKGLRVGMYEIALARVNLIDPETKGLVLRIAYLVLLPGITLFYGPRGAGKTPLCYLLSGQIELGVRDGTIQFGRFSGSEVLFREVGVWPMAMGRFNYNLDQTLAATLGEPSEFPPNPAWRSAADKLAAQLGIATLLPFDSLMEDVTGRSESEAKASITPFSPEEQALLALLQALIRVLAEDLAVLILDQYFDQYISVSTMRKVARVLNLVVKRKNRPDRFIFITTDRPPSELMAANRTDLDVQRVINLRDYDPLNTGGQQCANCNAPVLPGFKFCSQCGQAV